MKIIQTTRLKNFEFWSQAADNAKSLSERQFETLEMILEDMYPEGIDAIMLNDLFWFQFDTIKEWLGIEEEDNEEEEDE